MNDQHFYTISQPADIASIRSALGHLYRKAAATDDSPVPVVRPTMLNIIVYSAEYYSLVETESVVNDVIAQLPARTVIVDSSLDSASGSKAEVALMCSVDDRGERRLCGDSARLATQGLGAEVAGLVTPLLEADIPTYLWIAGKPAQCDEQLIALSALVDYVVIDSRCYDCFNDALNGMSRYGRNTSVLDVCWASLMPWREGIAQHFDPPGVRPLLNAITEVEVLYEPLTDGSLPIAPLLLVSWLVERMGAEIEEASRADDGLVVTGRREMSRFVLKMTGCGCGLGQGDLVAVVIRCTGAGFATSRDDANCSRVHSLGGPNTQIHRVGAPSLQEHSKLIAYILRNPSDEVFSSSIAVAARLAAKAGL